MPTTRKPKNRKLTPRWIAAVTTDEQQEEFYDEVVPGLALRVGRGGTKTYIVRYRANGKHRRLKLGTHPRLSLADARAEARKTLGRVEAGEDPQEERRARRSDDATFRALTEEVLEAKAKKNRPGTVRNRRWMVDRHLLPAWGNLPAASIKRRDVIHLIERIADSGTPVAANRCLAVVRMIFNEGLEREFPGLEANPAHRVKAVAEEQSRDRFLTMDEIKKVWAACEWEAPVQRCIVRLAILTAQRIANIRALRWSAIDASDVWTITASEFKGRRVHKVPLSRQALAELAEIRKLTGDEEYAFPGRGDGATPHVNSTNKLMERLRKAADLGEPWTMHDFRTSFRTHACRAKKPAHRNDPAGLGIDPRVADACLGHKEMSLGFGTYTGDASSYMLAEKRDALTKWGRFVAAAVKGGAS